jgi:broad specificity phosphatase PhoE
MKVLLVRHAQSQNNIVQARVHTKVQAGVSSEVQAQHEWLCVNPPSTPTPLPPPASGRARARTGP